MRESIFNEALRRGITSTQVAGERSMSPAAQEAIHRTAARDGISSAEAARIVMERGTSKE